MLRKMSHEQLTKFKAWLSEHGASVLAPTNEWELVRWSGDRGVCVIYFNKQGYMTMRGETLATFKAYKEGRHLRITEATPRKRVSPVVRALRARDGDLCFYCHQPVPHDNNIESVEHLVAVTHGGPHHMSNYVLAHARCNHMAGHLSVMDKVRVRERNRKELEEESKWCDQVEVSE